MTRTRGEAAVSTSARYSSNAQTNHEMTLSPRERQARAIAATHAGPGQRFRASFRPVSAHQTVRSSGDNTGNGLLPSRCLRNRRMPGTWLRSAAAGTGKSSGMLTTGNCSTALPARAADKQDEEEAP